MKNLQRDYNALIVAWAVVLYPLAVLTTKVISVFLGYSFKDFVLLLLYAFVLEVFIIFYISAFRAIYKEFNRKE